MKKRNSDFINELVNMFGYDYVIGFCLCSEYDLRQKADAETNPSRKKYFHSVANNYNRSASNLTRERIDNGL